MPERAKKFPEGAIFHFLFAKECVFAIWNRKDAKSAKTAQGIFLVCS
jgi:hypothetical protein